MFYQCNTLEKWSIGESNKINKKKNKQKKRKARNWKNKARITEIYIAKIFI